MTKILGWIAAAVAVVAAIALLTVYDLPISQALVGQWPVVAHAGEILGQWPLIGLALVAPLVLWFSRTRRGLVLEILRGVLLFALSSLGAFFGVLQSVMYVVGEDAFRLGPNLPLIASGAAVVLVGSLLVVRAFGRNRLLGARRFAWIGLLLLLVDMIFVETLKNVFGRTRPREMTSAADFSPWYTVHGTTGRKSFPSGHSAYGFGGLAWAFLWKVGTAGWRNAVLVALAFGLFVALSRVLIGAHFPTDVMMGGVFTCLFTVLLGLVVRETRSLA
jgi:membrane-associated phospholipid phosphatase